MEDLEKVKEFLLEDLPARFVRYARVYTTASLAPKETNGPSSKGQWKLLEMLKSELLELGLKQVELDENGYLYAVVPPTRGIKCEDIGFLAHVDTSPDQSGRFVKPRLIKDYDGSPISYPDNPELELTTANSPQLKNCLGHTIITASGKTLLGADDKAGVAEIMSVAAALMKFKKIPHGKIVLCFTRDEEIGCGVNHINLERLPTYCYTVDGASPNELEDECFTAWGFRAVFKGFTTHPGYAKGKLANALKAAAAFVDGLPPDESPERTGGTKGFIHPMHMDGTTDEMVVSGIIRDFKSANCKRRIAKLEELGRLATEGDPRFSFHLETRLQYQNMKELLKDHPRVTDHALAAIKRSGLTPKRERIRGGTDGSRLTFQGKYTPNLGSGAYMIHSKLEWTSDKTMAKCAEVIVNLAMQWAGH